MELEGEQQRHAETAKAMRRQERRLKELTGQLEEDRTTHERMHDVIEKLHQKLKIYKRQIDDAVCNIHFYLFCRMPWRPKFDLLNVRLQCFTTYLIQPNRISQSSESE